MNALEKRDGNGKPYIIASSVFERCLAGGLRRRFCRRHRDSSLGRGRASSLVFVVCPEFLRLCGSVKGAKRVGLEYLLVSITLLGKP